jgi:hypothetical protein
MNIVMKKNILILMAFFLISCGPALEEMATVE